jgi:phosphate transport system protein
MALPRKAHVTETTERRSSAPLVELAARACLVAKDAAYNLRDFTTHSSRMAMLIIRQCERELDHMEREIDDKVPEAMVRVGERTARELLAAVRFITDLERIGDLLLWVAKRPTLKDFAADDKEAVVRMLKILEQMLEAVHNGLLQRDLELAMSVLRQDPKIDRIRREVFDRHLQGNRRKSRVPSVEALLVVQSIERAGDHATNLAEELVHLVERRSIRHTKAIPLEV